MAENKISDFLNIQKEAKEEKKTVNVDMDTLKELLLAVVNAQKQMNPLEEKKYKEELEKERRKALLVKQLGEDEERQIAQRRGGCTHCVDKDTGHPVARGQGIWCTQGQVHSNDVISLICMRCSTVWYWRGTPMERAYAIDAEHGLLHIPPPSPERLITDISSI